MRQWPAWGCWSESSCLRTFSFWTKSLSYLWAGSSSSSTEPSLGNGSGWLGSFSWHWWLEKNRNIKVTPKVVAKGATSNTPAAEGLRSEFITQNSKKRYSLCWRNHVWRYINADSGHHGPKYRGLNMASIKKIPLFQTIAYPIAHHCYK